MSGDVVTVEVVPGFDTAEVRIGEESVTVVGVATVGLVPVVAGGVPDGGTDGQVLTKLSATDGDADWEDPTTGVPDGGTTGQTLVKQSNTDGDADWATLTATDVGADPAGTATAAVAAHEALSDPHPGYLTPAEGNAAYDATGAADAAIISSTAAEFIRDTIGVALIEGARIQITVSDAGDTITVAVVGLQQSDVAGLVAALSNETSARIAADDTKAPIASPTFTGSVTLPGDPGSALQAATKQYVDALIAASDAVVYKGVIDASANPNYPAADAGHLYRISVAGKIGGAAGVNVEAGDSILCLADGTAAGNQATVGAFWNVVQVNLDGAVIGPTSVTSGNVAVFSGTTGKLIAEVAATTFGKGLLNLADAAAGRTALGLGNVDNTSDANKPVSTAQQAALDLKAAKADNLSVFAATSSAQLRGVLSDETGTGAAVFATSPALVTPTGIVASDIASGQFAMARIASGTPTGSKFVRDDGTLQVPVAPTDPTLAVLQRQQFK